tara:strand:- start:58 stop:441 length:384 start_codon:yes stop_codon:yes gene_type:complete
MNLLIEKKIKPITIYIMSLFYILVGFNHFQQPEWYAQIVPPPLPCKLELVYLSGFFEVLFGILILFKKFRFIIGWSLIALLVAVYPANIYLALTNGLAMQTTPLIAWGRLPFQFLFIYLAYWHSKDT